MILIASKAAIVPSMPGVTPSTPDITDEWLYHYNYERPHQALGMLPPIINKAA